MGKQNSWRPNRQLKALGRDKIIQVKRDHRWQRRLQPPTTELPSTVLMTILSTPARQRLVSICMCSVAVQLFLQPNLDQGLVGNISGICSNFDRIQQVLRQTQRNGLGGGLQVWQRDPLGLRPIQMF